ncbi:hypothetical protein BRC67_03445 [Halobacteriales archaeon QH_3_68_24]|nr:MAG: hypothetical protein BRC67_03445 [Halobacteriales archaeon QH_3_68_24]
MVADRPLVVLVGGTQEAVDDLADRLREACTVRTTRDTAEALARLGERVDVVVLGPGLGPDAAADVRRAVDERDLPCHVLPLVDGSGDESGEADDRATLDAVERLAALAQYRRALDEYFALAEGAATDDAPERIGSVRDRLDEAAADLDAPSLFEVALRDPGSVPPADLRSEADAETGVDTETRTDADGDRR